MYKQNKCRDFILSLYLALMKLLLNLVVLDNILEVSECRKIWSFQERYRTVSFFFFVTELGCSQAVEYVASVSERDAKPQLWDFGIPCLLVATGYDRGGVWAWNKSLSFFFLPCPTFSSFYAHLPLSLSAKQEFCLAEPICLWDAVSCVPTSLSAVASLSRGESFPVCSPKDLCPSRQMPLLTVTHLTWCYCSLLHGGIIHHPALFTNFRSSDFHSFKKKKKRVSVSC